MSKGRKLVEAVVLGGDGFQVLVRYADSLEEAKQLAMETNEEYCGPEWQAVEPEEITEGYWRWVPNSAEEREYDMLLQKAACRGRGAFHGWLFEWV